MLLLIDIFSINKRRGYENPSLEIIVTERCSTGGCPLEEACEHCYLNQSAISVAISYIISVYCEDYAGYFTVILSFLAFHFCSCIFYISGILQKVLTITKKMISTQIKSTSTIKLPHYYKIGTMKYLKQC
jgi:hypothetical protein